MPSKDDILNRRANLSPAKRALLEKRLKGEPVKNVVSAQSSAKEQTGSKDWSPLIKIQPSGTRRPFYLVHASNGSVFGYLDLARRLGSDQPLYGLQAPGLDGEQEPFNRIEDLASLYIRAMRVAQPEGPYLLGGYSMGGAIAFEMAQQLRKQGQEPGLLALMDIYPQVQSNRRGVYDNLAEIEYFIKELEHSFRKEMRISNDELRKLSPDERVEYVLEQARNSRAIDPDNELPHLHRLLRVFQNNIEALTKYEPAPYPNRIIVFKANDNVVEGSDTARVEYSSLVPGGMEIHVVPGQHFTMLREPLVKVLAGKLKACLDNAQ